MKEEKGGEQHGRRGEREEGLERRGVSNEREEE
jgi:hypothetical protein